MAAPGILELLDLQDIDIRLDQLRHRRSNHPLAGELRAIEAEAGTQQAAVDEIAGRRHELERQQKRLEDEIALLDERRAEVEKKLYDGSVTASKDLLALQAESAHLAERKRAVEDVELEIMEALEPVMGEHNAALRAADAIAVRRATKEVELHEAIGAVQDELASLEPRRAQAAGSVEPGLLTAYEALRIELGGVAVARLVGGTCGGCHLSLPAVDADRIRRQPDDAIVRCPECSRLLVR
jgi:uncharacterized protein